jgi:hypothetical protein
MRFCFQILAVLALFLHVEAGPNLQKPQKAEIGSLTDLDGRNVDLFSTNVATVLIFISVDCPISNKYAPEIRRLIQRYSQKQVNFWLVYPDASTTTTQIRQHLKDYNYTAQAIPDPKHTMVKFSGVKVTPEVVVFQGKRILYHGRIDDRFPELGVVRPEATKHELDDVLAALSSGKKLEFSSTRAVGCSIQD